MVFYFATHNFLSLLFICLFYMSGSKKFFHLTSLTNKPSYQLHYESNEPRQSILLIDRTGDQPPYGQMSHVTWHHPGNLPH